MHAYPSLSTDQVAAFVELARQGSLRLAAESLLISEQGVRNRLLTLERRLGVELYRKSRGVRRSAPLTAAGRRFLPHAIAFLERAGELSGMFSEPAPREVQVAASQYLIAYVLIDAVRRFHTAQPEVRVRLCARREREIEQALLETPELCCGVAAPYERLPELAYEHLFSMTWSLITPLGHPLALRPRLRLEDLAEAPLILYEQGSTGRQHVIEAFQRAGASLRVEMEATNTDLIVRMVEAGLGVSVVPLLSSGQVTRGRQVAVRSLGRRIRPIDSGILTRRGERLSSAAQSFIAFVKKCQDSAPAG